MIEESLPVLAFVYGLKQYLGMYDSLVNGVHCKIVRRNMDSGMEEEFLDCKPGISYN